jgi:outer membrane protein TolC
MPARSARVGINTGRESTNGRAPTCDLRLAITSRPETRAQGTLKDQLEAQEDLVTAARDSADLANARYAKGVDTFLVALTAQRTLYAAQQSRVSAQLTALSNRITLYKVLGGGAGASS